jgi:hypothetical protein
MIDDHRDARPQSGFNAASLIWQAPAEGGIPRYMLVFAENDPAKVGPVRSARQYFIQWAAEWRAAYVHAGGSPQALATLKQYGTGKYVYNADDFRWEGVYLWRIKQRVAPHNLYTDGKNLLKLAKRVGAKPISAQPAWRFAPALPVESRPAGARIDIAFPYSKYQFRYDRASNTWVHFVEGKKQVDAGDGQPVAPTNVVVMVVKFGPLNDGHPQKHRLEAQVIGTGKAWIFTNGKVQAGKWRKNSITDPVRFYDKNGNEVTLTVGQTFIEVVPTATYVKITPGKPAAPAPGASPTPAP